MARKDKPNQMGEGARKLDTKLRMIANGRTEVNIVRAERTDALAVARTRSLAQRPLSMQQVLADLPPAAPPARGSLGRPSREILANVFITTSTPDRLPATVVRETGRVGTLATATVRLADVPSLARQAIVRQVSLGQGLRDPDPVRSVDAVTAPGISERKVGEEGLHDFGKGVLVGLIDVEGFDFSHPDFLDRNGKTRFHAIWDQGGDGGASAPFGYGREITKARMNAAISAAPRAGAPAFELEPQSQRVPGAHATHVASIAAGNRGVAREATLVGVLISLGPEDTDVRRSFYDSTRLAHAVDYLFALGEKLDMPVSINVSLGTNGHAHDSSAPVNRWIDALLTVNGRSVCVAAGNAGQEAPEEPGDYGWVMGRIHTSGQLAAAGLDTDIDWVVAGSGGRDYSENELELWFHPQDRIEVSLRTPAGRWLGPIRPREFIENQRLADGSFVSIYNELYHPANGCNYVGVYLSPNLLADPIIGVSAGTWTLRVHGLEIRDGHFDGWIERDDPARLPGGPEEAERWRFPSIFSARSNVDRSSISTLACGNRIVAVGNLDAKRERIKASSSQGPTRDGRQKPDVSAPGTDIVAARGFDDDDHRWMAMTGTSMASPYVCGVVALMLGKKRDLSAAQIVGILQRTARPLPGSTFSWQNDAGFGEVAPVGCVREAAMINQRDDKTP